MIIRIETYCSLTVFGGVPDTLSKAKIRTEIEIPLFWPSQFEDTICLLMEVVFQKILSRYTSAGVVTGYNVLSAIH